MALAGVNDVYASGSQLLKAFLGLDIAASQLYRVTNYLGEQITTDLAQPVEHPPLADDELIYGSVDGSMILTDPGWQEVKVGRVFTSEARIEAGQKGESQTRFRLSSSTYCAHLGEHTDFTPLFEASLGPYKSQPERLVLLSDGGVWIQNYFGQHYPKATHILDYYHRTGAPAVEHLAAWVRVQFKGSKSGAQWLDRQRDSLLSNGVGDVIEELETRSSLSRESGVCRDKLVGYYKRNRDRMQYGTYRMRGLQIGSGAIEAAHRTVVQCRMKRSGQRWSEAGSQAMLNLRVASKSGRWQLVKDRLNSV